MIKKSFYSIILLFSILFLVNQDLKATHIMGGEITWECNGSGQYIFKFSIYRDCSGTALAPRGTLFIHNYPNPGDVTPLSYPVDYNANASVDQPIVPACDNPDNGLPYDCATNDGGVSIFEYRREADPVTLIGSPKTSDGWIITYHDNARNGIDNIQGTSGITLRAKIFSHALTVANQCVDNSPIFREKPTSLLCGDNAFDYNHNASDVEYDSLDYQWAESLEELDNNFPNSPQNPVQLPQLFRESGPSKFPTSVIYAAGYSAQSPFPGTVTLDNQTGAIQYTPPAVIVTGEFVSAVKVSAYKCGQKVAEIYRELQSDLVDCSASGFQPNNQPDFNGPFLNPNGTFGFKDTIRAGDLVNFDLQIFDFASASNPHLDSIEIIGSSDQFGANFTDPNSGCSNPPCATLTGTNTRVAIGRTETFNWQTDCNHVLTDGPCISLSNTYNFVIIAKDDFCPIPGERIKTFSITILADSVIDSPPVHCLDVANNGDVTLNWSTTPDFNGSFSAWMIYSAPTRNGPFTVVDSIKTYNVTSYTDIGANADQQQVHYVVKSRSGCKGIVENLPVDTFSTIFVDPIVNGNDVIVQWNALSNPNPSGSANQYRVFREYPIGSGLSFYANSTATNIPEIFNICEDSVRYRVELQNPSNGCVSSSAIRGFRFKFPDPQTDFSFPANPCPATVVNFTNLTTISSGSVTYLWDFGDASSSTLTSPGHTYANPGTYTVNLTSTSAKGCVTTIQKLLTVTLPDVDAGPDVAICPTGSVPIGGSPTTSTTGSTIFWFPSAGLNSTSAANPIASPGNTTTYTVRVTDAAGCTNEDMVTVTVNPIPFADAGNPQTICEGLNVTLGGNPTGPATAMFAWSPSATLNDPNVAAPIATPFVTTTYTVTVTSGVNCSATSSVTITVNPEPGADAGFDKSICPGASTLIGGTPTSGSSNPNFSWSPSAGLDAANIANPIASPTSTTTYTVIVTNSAGCTSADDVIVTVFPNALADAGPDENLCLGSSVQIGGQPTGLAGSAYNWSGAFLSSNSIANPTVTPTITSMYSVTVTDANGCIGTDNMTVFVNTLPIANAGADDVICAGETVQLGVANNPLYSYQWDNSGTLTPSATVSNPVAMPIVTTIYTVTVTETSTGCTATDMVTITVNPLPLADAGLDATICNTDSAQIGAANNPLYTYLWDNSTATLGSATISNPKAGPSVTTPYTVTVTETSTGCTAVDNVTVFVNSLPTVAFTYADTCLGTTTVFTNTSTNSQYAWDFGDGVGTSNLRNPTYTYATPGIYFVKLVAGDATTSCSDSLSKTIEIKALPVADAGTDITICDRDTLDIGAANNPLYTYAWDNGASLSSATISDPRAFPATTTIYTVTVTEPSTGCTATSSITITVDPVPVAGFTVLDTCAGNTTTFTNTSTGGSTFTWNFGDGSAVSTAQNPTHSYALPGFYTVKLVVGNNNGTTNCLDSISRIIEIKALPTADAGADDVLCFGETAQLGVANNPLYTYSWDNFGSLTPSATVSNPIATPSNTTTYTVTVTETSTGCTATDMVTITVNPLPLADAGLDATICNTDSAQIGAANNPLYTYLWDNSTATLGSATISNPKAGPSVTTPYTVTVTETSTGCTDVDNVTVFVDALPIVAFTYADTCLGTATVFNNTSTGSSQYAWDFGDGVGTSNQQNPTYTYATPGIYFVKLVAGDATTSCSDSLSKMIEIKALPVADAGTDITICDRDTLDIGAANNPLYVYAWDNGTSLTSATISDPRAFPATTTIYTVTVTEPSTGCSATSSITITVDPVPVAGFTVLDTCAGNTTTFTNTSTGGSAFTWNFGDGSAVSTAQDPTHSYALPGFYTVKLIVGNNNGTTNCLDSISRTIEIKALPTADAGADDVLCFGETAQLGVANNPLYTYSWDNFGSLTPSATVSNPTATPSNTTTYTITVTETSTGCTATDMVTITVNPLPLADAGLDATICNTDSAQIGAANNPLYTYLWDNSTATLSSATISNPKAGPSVTTPYTVTVTETSTGCTDVDNVTVFVDALPIVAFTYADTCLGTATVFNNTSTGSGQYAWDFGDGTGTSNLQNPTYTYATPGIYFVKLVAGDATTSCSDSLSKTIEIKALPVADAGTDITICDRDTIDIGAANNPLYVYAWDNGTSLTSATISDPRAFPATTTIYTVTVTEPSTGCSATSSITITVDPVPVAGFTVLDTCAGNTTTFTNTSTGGSAFTWDFGDGSAVSTVQNPTHSYALPGFYTVKLIVGNNNGTTNCLDSISRTIEIKALPTADAGADDVLCFGETAQLGVASNPLYSYQWDNSGTLTPSAMVSNPVAMPIVTTIYTVTVTETSTGCTATDMVTITVNPLPLVDAGADVTICNTDSAQLGAANNPLYTYLWDNSTATLSSATISNPKAGPSVTTPYTVTVTETSTGCTDVDNVTVFVDALPIVDFTYSDTCLGTATVFNNISTGSNQYAWDFGDGVGTSNQQNPTYTYATPGIYFVKLVAGDATTACSDSLSKMIEIKALPVADAGTDNTICDRDTIDIGAANNPLYVYAWDNGTSLTSATISDPRAFPATTTIYTVTVTEPSTGCSATSSVTITVDPVPVAGFTVLDTCAGNTTTFTNTSTGGSAFTWNFGDGSAVSTAQDPTHSYALPGFYTVKLIVGNNNGTTNCLDSISRIIEIKALPIADAGANNIICAGETTQIGSSDNVLYSYEWDNAPSLSDEFISDPFATPPFTTLYTVTVTEISTGCTSTDDVNIIVNQLPLADAGADVTICNTDSAQIGAANNIAYTYLWDNSTATLNSTTISDPKAGPAVTTIYTVTVTENSTGCTEEDMVTVFVNSLPDVNFTYADTCFNDNTQFTNTSLNGNSFEWDFGDGVGTSVLPNPTYQFTSIGFFDVKLIVTSGLGCLDSISKQIEIKALPLPDAGAADTICARDTSQIGAIDNPLYSYAWDNPATLTRTDISNPKAFPLVTTVYTVTVTEISTGCDAVDQVEVFVHPVPLTAFSASSTCINEITQFTDLTSIPLGSIDFWSWDFGDGVGTSTMQNPAYQYGLVGTYPVKLVVTSNEGCMDSISINIDITPIPVVDFSFTTACLNQATQFMDLTSIPSGTFGGWSWDFGDGIGTDNVANPSYQYTSAGVYAVKLVVESGFGCKDSIIKNVTINPLPVVDFNFNNTCVNELTSFNDASTLISGSLQGWAWDFGDGIGTSSMQDTVYQYAAPGTYLVKLVVETDLGCKDSITKSVIINPIPVVDFTTVNTCFNDVVQFTDISTITSGTLPNRTWDFGDGIGTSISPTPTYTYAAAGVYAVKLVVESGFGCKDSIIKNVTITPLPDVEAGLDATICQRDTIILGGGPTSTIFGATYLWDNSSTIDDVLSSNPKAFPLTTTLYKVTVTDPLGCSDMDSILVTVNPVPTAAFSASQVCEGVQTVFTDQSTILPGFTIVGWAWDFGDGVGTSSMKDTVYQYASSGNYSVKLVVTSDVGCMDSIITNVVVDTLPTAFAGLPQVICENDTIQLGKPAVTGETYLWDNASTLSATNVARPFAFPIVPTTYTVVVTNTNGCSSTDQVFIGVNVAPNIDAGADITICNRDTTLIGGSPSSNTLGATYLWDNTNFLDDPLSGNPRAFPNVTTTFTLVVTDAVGCTSTEQMTVFVNPLPVVDFKVEETCFNDFAAFTDLSTIVSGSNQSWSWDFGNGIGTSNLQNPGYQYPVSGSYDVTLRVTSDLGCIDTIVKNITINPLPIADAGADANLCFGDSIALGGNPTGPIDGVFSWNPGSGLSDASLANPIANPFVTTKYYLSVTDQNGCINYDSVNVVVNPLPIITATPTDTSLCVDEPVQLNATGAVSYVWSPSEWLNNPLIGNPIATTTENVDYVVFGTDVNGCISTDTVKIEVFNVNFTVPSPSICFGDSAQLTPIIQGVETGITYLWSPSLGLNSTTIREPMASPLVNQEYKLEITNSVGCVDSDSVLVEILPSPIANFDVVNSPRCSGSILEIQNNSSFTAAYQWYLNDVWVSDQLNPELQIDNTIENTLKLICFNNTCNDTLEQVIPAATLKELLQLQFVNVFTPNGDGQNDLFTVGFTGEFVGCTNFQVYNRAGVKVFDTNIGQYGWDGRTLKGDVALSGVYFYVVRIANEEIRGSVYLSR